MHMKRYLVTGGAGFIGSNFIHYLLAKYGREVEIINIDKLTYAGQSREPQGRRLGRQLSLRPWRHLRRKAGGAS